MKASILVLIPLLSLTACQPPPRITTTVQGFFCDVMAILKAGVRYFTPPVDFTFHIDYEPYLPTKGLLKTKGSGKREAVIAPGINHTLWARCSDNQTSQETNIGGAVRGVFTYNFCQVLRRTAAA